MFIKLHKAMVPTYTNLSGCPVFEPAKEGSTVEQDEPLKSLGSLLN